METKKFLLASAAASGILATGSLLWYGLMRDFYKSQSARGSRRSSPSLGVDALARAVYGVALAASYPRSHSNARSPEGRGFRTGILTGAIASLPSSLSEYASYRMSLPAALITAGFETVLAGVAGTVVGSIYGERPKPLYEDVSGYVEIDREPAEGPVEEETVRPYPQHNGRKMRVRR